MECGDVGMRMFELSIRAQRRSLKIITSGKARTRASLCFAILATTWLITGCATIRTQKYPTESCAWEKGARRPVFIYSGTRCDLALIAMPSLIWTIPLGLIDLPLSLAADTIILPWTIYRHVRN